MLVQPKLQQTAFLQYPHTVAAVPQTPQLSTGSSSGGGSTPSTPTDMQVDRHSSSSEDVTAKRGSKNVKGLRVVATETPSVPTSSLVSSGVALTF